MKNIKNKPLMNQEEIDYIESRLSKGKTLFEWGPGGSTIHFSKFVKSYNSVEHDDKWADKVADMIQEQEIKNVKLYYAPADIPWNIWERGHSILLDNRNEEFKSYIKAIDHFGKKKYDFFIIDGRARVQCCEMATRYSHKDTIVFLCEYYRPRYKAALEWYDLVEEVGGIAVLRPKAKWMANLKKYGKPHHTKGFPP